MICNLINITIHLLVVNDIAISMSTLVWVDT